MGKDKKVEEALKRLEQGIEKIAEVFDQYTETLRQEMAFINQKITDLESRIDSIEAWPSFTGEGAEAIRRAPARTGISSELASQTIQKPMETVSKPPAETYAAQPREAEAEAGYRPSTPTRQPARRALEPAKFVTVDDLRGEEPSQEAGFGGYRPMRGGIVEEKFVKPSVFSKEMNKLHEARDAAAQTPYGPGGYTPPPSMQLRQEVSRVLGKIKPEAQRRVPRPPPVQEYGPDSGYQAPSRPAYGEEYGAPQPASPAYSTEPPPGPAGEAKSISVPDNWLPESSRAKYYDPKKIKKGKVKDMEKKTKDIFKK